MKQCLLIVCVVTMIFGVTGMAQALPVRIYDNFIGGDDHGYGDVIGNPDVFGIDWMDVDIVGTTMNIDIRTPFTEGASGTYGVEYGDLFISVDGYTPETEVWEYVFDVSERKLYDIRSTAAQSQIILANMNQMPDPSRYVWRDGQEVQIDPTGLTALTTGGSAGRNGDYYSLSFDISGMSFSHGADIGFHWAMTCGNDTIEAGYTPAPVPEPGTMLLLGAGMIGLFAVGRKKMKK